MPMQPEMEYTGEKPVDPLIVNVFPLADGQSTSYTLYDDAASTRAYEQGEATWTDLRALRSGADVTVEIAPVRGGYPDMPQSRGYEVRLLGDWPPDSVTVNDQPLDMLAPTMKKGTAGWRYEGNTLTTVITVPTLPISVDVKVVVHRSAALVARQADLDGFAGMMTRLREAYDSLNQIWPLGWSPDALEDAMQTGDRLSYRPQNAAAEIDHLREVLPQALAALRDLAKPMDESMQKQVLETVGLDAKSPAALDRVARYQQQTKRALAQLEDAMPSSQ